MIIVYDPRCLEYAEPGHPESPERLRRASQFLKRQGGYGFRAPSPATDEDVLRVHSEAHLESVKRRMFSNPDCPRYPDIYAYAALSAGAAIHAARVHGFSLMRPPGHHAGRSRVAGFCYLNNIAVAVRASGRKTLIVDIDGHHGDGTQEIFMGDDQVVFVSLHSSPNYPGTGLKSRGNCYNYPLPLRCGEEAYLSALERALGEVDLSDVEEIAVSAGFDTYERDPLASLGLHSETYREIGRRIAALGLPAFAVLEGGYDPDALGPNIHEFLQGLASQDGT